MENNIEVWRDIPEFPTYRMELFSGRIFNKTKKHEIIIQSRRGWEFIRLTKNKKSHYRGLEKLYKTVFPEYVNN